MEKEKIEALLKKYEKLVLKWKKNLKERNFTNNENDYIMGIIYAFYKIINDLENLL